MNSYPSQFSNPIQRGHKVALLANAPAFLSPARAAPRRETRQPVEEPPTHLEPVNTEMDFRVTFLMLLGGIIATILLFLSLPYTQKLSERAMDRAFKVNMDWSRPPPPPPAESRPREEPKPEEIAKPELKQETPKLNLAQLEAALNPGFGGTGFADFSLNFGELAAEDLSRVFELAELDRSPMAIYQIAPMYPFSLKNAGVTGSVTLRFIVNPLGSVTRVTVISSSRQEFEREAINAVQKWKFEPGIKSGIKVSVWMEQPFHFNLND